MEYFELPNQLMTERDELDLNGNQEKSEEIDQRWNGLIQILDDLVLVFGDEPKSMERFL